MAEGARRPVGMGEVLAGVEALGEMAAMVGHVLTGTLKLFDIFLGEIIIFRWMVEIIRGKRK